jgi:hypothetical protein
MVFLLFSNLLSHFFAKRRAGQMPHSVSYTTIVGNYSTVSPVWQGFFLDFQGFSGKKS